MVAAGRDERGNYLFEVSASCRRSGLHGYTARVRPSHPDLAMGFLPGLITWAETGSPAAAANAG
jgi:hypothetical protein